jgi:hypothetical protein
MNPSKPCFSTVRVVSEGEGSAVVEVVSNHVTWDDAAKDAEKKIGHAPLITGTPVAPGETREVSFARYPAVERAVYERRRVEEVKETIFVCAWDRKFDHPIFNNVVTFTDGWDQGNPQPDRVAQPYGKPVPDLASKPAWVVVERFDTLEPEGLSLAVFETRKDAVSYAEQVRQERAREARREYDLARESFVDGMRQIAQQFHERTLARDGEGSHQIG